MEKYGTARHATYDGIIQCMCFVCWVTKGTDTHSEYAILIDFFMATVVSQTCINVMFIYTLPVLFVFIS